jgi:hypothetical protein
VLCGAGTVLRHRFARLHPANDLASAIEFPTGAAEIARPGSRQLSDARSN